MNWLGVVSRDHVRLGVALGIARIGHGRRSGLDRMAPGDRLIYYSSRTSLTDGAPLRAFTAFGEVADEELWQADEDGFRPWCRRVTYDPAAVEVPLDELRDRLELTAGPNWGVQLRRGLVPLSDADTGVIRSAMLPS